MVTMEKIVGNLTLTEIRRGLEHIVEFNHSDEITIKAKQTIDYIDKYQNGGIPEESLRTAAYVIKVNFQDIFEIYMDYIGIAHLYQITRKGEIDNG